MENLQANSWKDAKLNVTTGLWVTGGVNLTTKEKDQAPWVNLWGLARVLIKPCSEASLEEAHLHNYLSHKNTIPHWQQPGNSEEKVSSQHSAATLPCSHGVPKTGYNTVISAASQQSVWNSECLVNLSLQFNDKSDVCFSCVNMEQGEKN